MHILLFLLFLPFRNLLPVKSAGQLSTLKSGRLVFDSRRGRITFFAYETGFPKSDEILLNFRDVIYRAVLRHALPPGNLPAPHYLLAILALDMVRTCSVFRFPSGADYLGAPFFDLFPPGPPTIFICRLPPLLASIVYHAPPPGPTSRGPARAPYYFSSHL